MIIRRIGNDIPIRWVIERDGVAEDFSGLTLKLYIQEVGGERFECEGFAVSDNVISYTWAAGDQKEPGIYSIILEEYDDGELVNTVDEHEAIHLTTSTQEQEGLTEAAVFTTDIQGLVSSYGSLEELLAQAQAKIASMEALNAAAQAKIDALTIKINALNETMRQAAEYQLTYGNAGKAYTDAKFSELIAAQQQQYQSLISTLDLLKGSMIEGFEGTISPLAIQAMMAIFGSENLQYEFINDVDGNPDHSYTVINYQPVVRTTYNPEVIYAAGDEVVYGGHYYRLGSGTSQGESPDVGANWVDLGSVVDDDIQAEIYLPATAILHHTFGINAVSPSFDVHQFQRWEIEDDTHLPLLDDFSGYYVYIKANKTGLTPDSGSTSDNAGGTGTAEFILTTEGKKLDPGDGYYYFLHLTVNAVSGGRRVVTPWNGFTSIKPGEIQANKFISTDGRQFTDYQSKTFRIGGDPEGTGPFIEWNLDYGDGPSGELRMRGVIQQLPDGEKAVIPRWRGQYNASKYYYYGDVVYHNGSAWIMSNSGVPSVIGQEPSLANTNYWSAWSLKGDDGDDGAPGAPGANGTNGTNGTNGISVATVTIFKRSAGVPNGPSANCTYNVETGALVGGLNGWTTDIDSLTGTNPCWACVANIQTRDTTVTIYPHGSANTPQWSGPTRFTGTDGVPGANGITRYTVHIYHQGVNTAAPSLPSNTVDYSPGGGEFEPELNNGWSPYIDPVGGPVCWESHAVLDGDDPDEAISVTPSMWSSPIRLTGDTGLMGKVMRGVNEYSTSGVKLPDGSGYEDYQGLYDTDTTHIYYDIVYMGSGSSRNYYYCVRSAGYVNNVWRYAKEVAPNSAAGASFWQAANNFQFVATNVLLAWDAYIDCLSGNAIYMKGSSDNIVAGVQGGDGAGAINFFAGTDISGSSSASTRLGNIATAPFRLGYDGHLYAEDATIKGSIECSGNNFTDPDETSVKYAIKSNNGLLVNGPTRLAGVDASTVNTNYLNVGGGAVINEIKSISSGQAVTNIGSARINVGVNDSYEGTVEIASSAYMVNNAYKLLVKGDGVTIQKGLGGTPENVIRCNSAERMEIISASSYAQLVSNDEVDPDTFYFIQD